MNPGSAKLVRRLMLGTDGIDSGEARCTSRPGPVLAVRSREELELARAAAGVG